MSDYSHVTPEQWQQVCQTLLKSDSITQEQFEWGKIFAVTDNDMAPELRAGGFVHAYLLDPTEYPDAVGKVVVAVRKTKPEQFVIGRTQSIHDGRLTLTFDCGDVPSRSVNLSGVGQVFLTTYALFNPLPTL